MKTAELQRGLSSLATVGSTAPFVGLFGTVMGIFDAFQKMSEVEGSGMAVVAGGMSEALNHHGFRLGGGRARRLDVQLFHFPGECFCHRDEQFSRLS